MFSRAKSKTVLRERENESLPFLFSATYFLFLKMYKQRLLESSQEHVSHECGSLQDRTDSDGLRVSTRLRMGQEAGQVHGRLKESSSKVHELKCQCT